MVRTREFMAVSLVTLLVGCASGGGGHRGGTAGLPEATDALEGLEGRRCDYVMAPSEVPDFHTVARAGTRGNIALWGRDMEPSDSVQISIRYGYDGRLQWATAIASTLEQERTSALERLVLEALSETGTPDWGLRLFVVGGDVVDVQPSVVCPAEQTRTQARRLLAYPASTAARLALYQLRGQRFPVRITLDDQGRIMDVRMARRSGNSEVDQFLLDFVRSARFEPKLHDGIGIMTTIDEHVAIPRRS